jgi:tripeptide aminopeptidase
MNRERLLQRFLQYVRIDSTANEQASTYPSSPGQLKLGRLLVEQLLQMGLSDARQDQHGIVWATVPGNVPGKPPVVAFNSHVDTSPETSGANVQPQVIENYDGRDLVLPGDRSKVITTAACPELLGCVGQTLVTTDGTTLLGGDDKAGVAIIMELAQHLLEHPEIPHGPVRLLFTCDEEIGRGTKHFDTRKAVALAGYTLDGGGSGVIDVESFSADQANITFHGHNIHPSMGKGRMVNALRAASRFLAMLPTDRLSPETTSDREGFIHPYVFHGSVAEASVQLLLRDFDTSKLAVYEAMLRELAAEVCRENPRLSVDIEIVEQYRNMADRLRAFPIAADLAEKAFQKLGIASKMASIRGGSDGTLMTQLGLPTPNLSVGQYNIHSVKEFASLNDMETAVKHAVVLLDLWQQHGRS